MFTFFAAARAILTAYKAVRALIGIMVVTHGAVVWAKNKRAG